MGLELRLPEAALLKSEALPPDALPFTRRAGWDLQEAPLPLLQLFPGPGPGLSRVSLAPSPAPDSRAQICPAPSPRLFLPSPHWLRLYGSSSGVAWQRPDASLLR